MSGTRIRHPLPPTFPFPLSFSLSFYPAAATPWATARTKGLPNESERFLIYVFKYLFVTHSPSSSSHLLLYFYRTSIYLAIYLSVCLSVSLCFLLPLCLPNYKMLSILIRQTWQATLCVAFIKNASVVFLPPSLPLCLPLCCAAPQDRVAFALPWHLPLDGATFCGLPRPALPASIMNWHWLEILIEIVKCWRMATPKGFRLCRLCLLLLLSFKINCLIFGLIKDLIDSTDSHSPVPRPALFLFFPLESFHLPQFYLLLPLSLSLPLSLIISFVCSMQIYMISHLIGCP